MKEWMNNHPSISSSQIGNVSRETTVKNEKENKHLKFLISSYISIIQSQVLVSIIFYINYKLVDMANNDTFYVCAQSCVQNCKYPIIYKAEQCSRPASCQENTDLLLLWF